jgi:hypothetical protein
MPPVIAAAVVAIEGIKLATIISFVAKTVIGLVVSQAFSSLLGSKPKKPTNQTPTQQQQDRLQTFRSSVAPRVVIYGTAVVAGPITYGTSSGGDNEYMHLIVPLAGHQVAGIDDVWINEDRIANADLDGSGNVTAGNLAGYVRVKKYLGATGQTADADLIAEAPGGEWTSAHKGKGVAYLYVRVKASSDKFPSGVQNVKAIVRGKKVFDPRTSTTAFTNNLALCVLDYLTASYGMRIGSSEWSSSHWQAQANICDQNITTTSGGATQKRYTIDGSFSLDLSPIDIVEDMLTAGVGALIFREGKYWLQVAEFTDRTVTITTKDLREGPVEVVARKTRRELFNTVRGTYVNPNDNYQPADFPPVRNTGYQAQDGGEEIARDIELPFIQDELRAQRLAKIVLERARQGIIVRLRCKLTVLRVAVWDVVGVTISDLGWTDKRFRVLEWRLTGDPGVDLLLQEDTSASYDWNYGEATVGDPAPDTALVSPFDPPASLTGMTLASGDAELDVRADGTIFSRLRVSWTKVPNIHVQVGGIVEIQYRKSTDTEWRGAEDAFGDATSQFILDVQDGVAYDVRARAVTSQSAVGPWAQINGHVVLGKLAAPSAPTTFVVSVSPDGLRLFEWTHSGQPADVRAGGGYRIRYYLGSTSTWSAMSDLIGGILTGFRFETTLLGAGTYTFALKAIDSSGNESATAVFASSVVLPDPPLAGALASQDERGDGWPGTKSANAYVDEEIIKATSTFVWDSATGTWDSYTASWDTLGADNSPITYETLTIDLGADALMKPIVTSGGTGTITVEMKTWKTGGSEPGSWSAVAQATARYIKIRWTITGTNPTLTQASVIIDAPSTPDYFNDVNTATETNNQSWFYRAAAGDVYLIARNGLAVNTMARINALQNVGAAYTWELVSKAATKPGGWTNAASGPAAQFRIRNAAGTLSDATIDVELRGPRA